MTRKNHHLRKLGNAIRRWKGTIYNPPKKKEKRRVKVWYGRCDDLGYLDKYRHA